MAESRLTASQRAAYFAQMTRQNLQMLPKQTTANEASTLQFNLPKARLLASIVVNCQLTFTCTGSGSYAIETPTVHDFVRRWSLDLNNGFSPYTVGGRELYYMNLLNGSSGLSDITAQSSVKTDGTDNVVNFAVQLSTALNPRDAIGLVLLQNDSTNVTLTADLNTIADVFKKDGLIFKFKEFSATPCVETFSIPASADAFPDLSVLKIVNSRNDSFVGAGQHIIRLSTGTIYRRMLFRLTDENGEPLKESDIVSDIQLVFNQADINYSVSAEALRTINQMQLGYRLPDGVYAFDFSYQGICNLGGSRDFIDTEALTEFWIKFSTNKSGRCELVTETLARLQ